YWLCDSSSAPLMPVKHPTVTQNPPLDGIAWKPLRQHGEENPEPRAQHIERSAQRFARFIRHFELAGRTPAAIERTLDLLRKRGSAAVLVEIPLSAPRSEERRVGKECRSRGSRAQ